VGLMIIFYILKTTFLPFPASPYNLDAYGATGTIVLGLLLPIIFPRLREGIRSSPLLRLGHRALSLEDVHGEHSE